MNYVDSHISDESLFTLNTTRVCRKNSVDESAPLVHFPINSPILLTDGKNLSKKILDEIIRLSPKGYNGIQVILFLKTLKTN